LVALFLLVPPILAPASQQGTKGAPEISFLSKPTATYSRDGDGNYWAEVHTSVYNNGPAPAAGVLVQATSFYCGNKYEPMNGGIQHFTVNGTIGAGHRADVELQLRVHGLNDTSITIETLIHNRVQLIGYIKSPKPAFLSNVGVTGYVTGLASGREANLSVSVFNDGKAVYAAGSLRVVATSYSPFSTRIESSETVLDRSLPTNSTWTYSVLLKVNELDLGHPFFMVELYNRGGSSPADAVTVDG